MNRQERRREGREARRKLAQGRSKARVLKKAPPRPVLAIPIPKLGAETEHAVRLAVVKALDAGIVDPRAAYAGLVCGFVVSREIEDQLTPEMIERWDAATEKAKKLADNGQLTAALAVTRAELGV